MEGINNCALNYVLKINFMKSQVESAVPIKIQENNNRNSLIIN